MLYVETKSGQDFSLHVGEPERACIDVTCIQADGDELDAIRDKLRNIPIVYTRPICTWRGEMAQFIYENVFAP